MAEERIAKPEHSIAKRGILRRIGYFKGSLCFLFKIRNKSFEKHGPYGIE